jgi:hypothetical protein
MLTHLNHLKPIEFGFQPRDTPQYSFWYLFLCGLASLLGFILPVVHAAMVEAICIHPINMWED